MVHLQLGPREQVYKPVVVEIRGDDHAEIVGNLAEVRSGVVMPDDAADAEIGPECKFNGGLTPEFCLPE